MIGTGLLGVAAGAAAGPIRDWATRGGTPPRRELPTAAPLLITDVTVVEPRTGESLARHSVLVREGRIIQVLPPGRTSEAQGVGRLDGAGRFLVPGYNNMHSHALQAEHPELLMVSMLAEGVTGFRQMAGTTDLLRLRAEHRIPVSSYAPGLLSMPGELLLPFNASSADDARAEVARQYDAGADFIKVAMVGRDAFFAAVEEARSRGLRIAGHLPAGVAYAEAAEAGFGSIEHLGTGPNVWIACSRDEDQLWKGQSGDLPFPGWVAKLPFVEDFSTRKLDKQLINPAAFAADEDVDVLRQALQGFDVSKARQLGTTLVEDRCWQSPTLVRLRTQYLMDDPGYGSDPWLDRMSAESRAAYDEVLGRFRDLPDQTLTTYRDLYARCLDVVGVWHDSGVRILAGTDGQGRAPGQWMQAELRELAAAGLSPLDVLRSTTSAPADYLGRQATLGTITPGADADMVLLAADPLADTENLATITTVVRSGHVHELSDVQAEVERLSVEGGDEALAQAVSDLRDAPDPCC